MGAAKNRGTRAPAHVEGVLFRCRSRSEPRGWRRGGCPRNQSTEPHGTTAARKETGLPAQCSIAAETPCSLLSERTAGPSPPAAHGSQPRGAPSPISEARRRTGRGRSSRNGPFPMRNSPFLAHRWLRHPHEPAERPFTLTSGRSLRAALTRYVRLRYALPAVRRASRQPTLRARSRVPRFARRRHSGDRSPSDNDLDPTRSRFRRMPRRPHGCVLSRTRGR